MRHLKLISIVISLAGSITCQAQPHADSLWAQYNTAGSAEKKITLLLAIGDDCYHGHKLSQRDSVFI